MPKLVKIERPRTLRVRQDTQHTPPPQKMPVEAPNSPDSDLFGGDLVNTVVRKKTTVKRREGRGRHVMRSPGSEQPAVQRLLLLDRQRNSPLPDMPLWTEELEQIEGYFSTHPLPVVPVLLDGHTVIAEPGKFLETHLATLKANDGRRTFLPYLDRLRALFDEAKIKT